MPCLHASGVGMINYLPIPCRQTALEALRAYPGGLHMGGGVSTDNAMDYLDAGASHVIVTSFVFREGRLDEERLKALVGKSTMALHPEPQPHPTWLLNAFSCPHRARHIPPW